MNEYEEIKLRERVLPAISAEEYITFLIFVNHATPKQMWNNLYEWENKLK